MPTYLHNSCETKYTNNTHKKRDLHQSNCSDSTHCFCCTNDVPVVEYCRWKGESLYRGWCSKTLFTESSLNFFRNTKDFLSTHICHGLYSLVQSNKWFSYKIWLHLKLVVFVGNIIYYSWMEWVICTCIDMKYVYKGFII